jgi:hypothetical protein
LIETASDLTELCRTFCGDAFPGTAFSFLEFGTIHRQFAMGTFSAEDETGPTVIFRECQSLAVCSANQLTDHAALQWDLSLGGFRHAATSVRDLVVGLVLSDLVLADFLFGLDLQSHERLPADLQVVWSGFCMSASDVPTICGIAEDRLWFRVDDQDEVLSVAG